MSFADICSAGDCVPVETMYGNCDVSPLALAYWTSGDATYNEEPKVSDHKAHPLGCMSVHGTAPMASFDDSVSPQPLCGETVHGTATKFQIKSKVTGSSNNVVEETMLSFFGSK
jgi:hypothetical protein